MSAGAKKLLIDLRTNGLLDKICDTMIQMNEVGDEEGVGDSVANDAGGQGQGGKKKKKGKEKLFTLGAYPSV